jgi:hypothetical protein
VQLWADLEEDNLSVSPMHIGLKEYLFGVIPAILQSMIAVAIIRRGLFRHFPIFTTYTIYQVVTITVIYVELAMHVSRLHYAYTWYPLQVCSIGLAFGVIFELFRFVLEPYDALRRVWRVIFLIASAVLIIVGVFWVLYGSGPQADRLTQTMNLLTRSLRLVQAGLMIFLFALSRSLGLSWRSYSFGLALGYGTYAVVELVLNAMRTQYGNGVWELQYTLSSFAYNIMILTWAWYILQPQTVAQPVRVIPHNDIEKWNQKLAELLKRTGT